MTEDRRYDVAIIGCGPVGALAANLAAVAGLSVLVIDKEASPHPLPRAVHLDHEMMRLFQSVGLEDVLTPIMRETQGHLHVGADGGVIRYMGTAGRPKPFGWSNDYFFFQPELEQVLRTGLARFDALALRLGTTVERLEQDEDGITLTLCEGEGTPQQVRASWVIACDGARSTVRRTLGVRLDDLDFEEPWLVIDAEVDGAVQFPDLWGVPDEADIQQLSVMMCDPRRPATIVPGRGSLRRWEFMLLPGEDDATMMGDEVVAALMAPYLAGVPHKIVRAATYRFHGLIAERWQVGRVFLAGDAAHQTPPFFGQGMCHGMRDVANLAWRLALVTRNVAHPALLGSYQQERDPHVRHVVSAAVAAGRYICELDREAATARDEAMRERARNGETGTAADLIPAYGAGAVLSATPAAGQRFIQPRLADGSLLDDLVGGGWRLFCLDSETAATAGTCATDFPRLALRIVDVGTFKDGGTLERWFSHYRVRAALVRPDHYVLGTAASDLGSFFANAAAALHLTSPAVRI